MPYKTKKVPGGHKVCKKDGGKCFSKKPLSKDKAEKQMAAIYANESLEARVHSALFAEDEQVDSEDIKPELDFGKDDREKHRQSAIEKGEESSEEPKPWEKGAPKESVIKSAQSTLNALDQRIEMVEQEIVGAIDW